MTRNFYSLRLAQLEQPLFQCIGAYMALKHYRLSEQESFMYWNLLEEGIIALFEILTEEPDDDPSGGGSASLLARCTQLYGKHCLR